MIVRSLKLKNYRNYEFLDMEFDEKSNILYGDNAQGKTNILEALYMSGTTKSHRGTKDRDIIRFGQEEAHIETKSEKNGVPFQVDMHLKKNSTKGIAVDRKPVRRAKDIFGIVHFVFFSPEDLNIVKSGPSGRRKFMDMELSQLDKIYLDDLTKYNRVVNQRNYLLRELYYKENLLGTLDVWDEQLAFYGEKIQKRRAQFIEELNPVIAEIHRRLTGGKEEIRLVYEPGSGDLPLEEELKRNREKDLRLKMTTCGPHRDDVQILSKDLDIRRFGSQGQQRTAALSLKLSEIEMVKRIIRDKPVLLLDDVLSELDKTRQVCLLECLDDIQTIITCTGMEDFVKNQYEANRVFLVKEGKVFQE